jgi:proteasome lid subunit RPN8/RPN11
MTKRITRPGLLARILEDPRFIDGVDKAIEVTQKTKCETKFDVSRIKNSSKVIYPDRILIGNEKSVGLEISLGRAREKFAEQYGRKPGRDNDKDYVRFLVESVQKQDLSAVSHVCYPIAKNDPDAWDNMLPDNVEQCENFLNSLESFLMFHTHPGKDARPSEKDFLYCKSNEGTGIVVAAQPIPSHDSHKEMHAFTIYSGEPLPLKEQLLAQIFGANPKQQETSLATGNYVPDIKRFEISRTYPDLRTKCLRKALRVFKDKEAETKI